MKAQLSKFIIIFFCFLSNESFTQVTCPCNQNDCKIDSFFVDFITIGASNVVCEGEEFIVQNKTKVANVKYFIFDWGDGVRDSVANYGEIRHTYNIGESSVCSKPNTIYEPCLIGVTPCGNKFTCNSKRNAITVVHAPRAKFTAEQEICKDKSVTFTNTSCNVDDSFTDAYVWDFGDGSSLSNEESPSHVYKSPGNYIVTLKVRNGCTVNNSPPLTIKVVDYPNAIMAFSENAKDSIVCLNEFVTIKDASNNWANKTNVWTYPNNKNPHVEKTEWEVLNSILKMDSLAVGIKDSVHYIDSIVLQFLREGKYTFRLKSMNACSTVVTNATIEVVKPTIVQLAEPTIFCETAQYSPNPTITGDVNSIKWSFPGGNPSTSTQKNPGTISYTAPGTYKVTLEVNAPCDKITREVNVVVVGKEPVTIIDPNKIFCKGNNPDTLKASKPGGTWSGQGIVDSQKGIFDTKNLLPGEYTITYKFGAVANCQSEATIKLTVKDAEAVTIKDLVLCQDSPPRNLIATPAGGTWIGNFIDAPNIFNPAKSGTGSFDLKYKRTDANGCTIEKDVNVKVEAFPIVSLLDTAFLCIGGGNVKLSEVLNITATPGQGTFTYSNKNTNVLDQIDLSTFQTGKEKFIVTYKRNECIVKDSASITFIAKPNLIVSKDTTVCINDNTLQLKTNTPGGKWIGSNINANGLIDLKALGGGNFTFSYEFAKGTTCEQVLSTKVNIKDPSAGLGSAGPNSICFGTAPTVKFGGIPSGGTWTGQGMDTNGNLTLSLLKSDTTYSYKYCKGESGFTNCDACVTKSFIIHSLPNPSFDQSGLACINKEITLVNTSSNFNPSLAKWNFGDGNTSNQNTDVIHKYTAKGSYNLSLEVTNDFGCKNSITKSIYVTTRPVPAFTLDEPTSPCAPSIFQAKNNSTGDDLSYLWTVNTKNYSSIDLPSITLDSVTKDTTFIIKLAVTNLCGTVNVFDSVEVKPYPFVDFGLSNAEGCSPLKVNFANTTIGNPKIFIWDLGNGVTSNLALPPSQTYTTTDSVISKYIIKLQAENDCGFDTLSKVITIYPPDVTAFIESPKLEACQYDTITYEAFSTIGSINTWKVISPSGKQLGGEGKFYNFIADESGNYKIILFAARCGSDADSIIVVVKPAPILDFKLPDFVCKDAVFTIENKSIQLASSIWDFGDGSNSNITNPSHKYNTPGEYTIRLIGKSLINGCDNSIQKQIKVVGLPEAIFNGDDLDGCEPHNINFTNSSINGTKYEWNFGDNSSGSNVKNPNHVFTKAGTYKVTLKTYDDFGCFADTSALNVLVYPKPIADFAFPNKKYCERYDSLSVLNKSSGAIAYRWEFATTTDTINKNLSVKLNASGDYTIRLIAKSNFGCLDELKKDIVVLPSPVSLIETSVNNGCEDLSVSFTNKSIASNRFIWNFGNGTPSVNKDTTYLYTNLGKYDAKLVAINDNGCPNDTSSKTIDVYPKPIALFTSIKQMECGAPKNITLTNNSTLYKDIQWFVNGIPFSQDINTAYLANEDRKYIFDMVIENEYNCKDTATNSIDVYLQPKADFK